MKARFFRLAQTMAVAALMGQSLASAVLAAEHVPFQVDYPAYLSNHDIVYQSPPTEGYEGFPLGNGDLGAMVWCTKSGLQVQINKNDTQKQNRNVTTIKIQNIEREYRTTNKQYNQH